MTQAQIDYLIDKTKGYLYYDRCNPEVGMGMFTETALQYALDSMNKEATVYNSSIIITISDTEKVKIVSEIRKWREQENI